MAPPGVPRLQMAPQVVADAARDTRMILSRCGFAGSLLLLFWMIKL